jgi:hypothetical protein
VDVPMLALDQSRSAWRIWALRGIGPTRAEEALGGSAFALCARDFGDRFQGSLRTDPAPLGVFGVRSAGSVLRSQEGSGQEGVFALCARGLG